MRKTFSIILVVLTVLLLASCASTQAQKKVSGEEYLSLWTEDAPLKNELIAYMEAITDPSSPDFIPVEDRIAVFDFDGTLFCETDPNYFDFCMLVYRVLQDPEYKDKASYEEIQTAYMILDLNETGVTAPDIMTKHGQAVASAFKGMTPEEFNNYVQEFKKQPMPSFEGMNRGGGYYLPMVQVVDYLQANDFTTYIISGTDRLIVRGAVYDSPIGYIPPARVIGSDESIVATGQGDADGLDYLFTADDKAVTGGQFLMKTLNMNKVYVIVREIGQQPVLAFGNSGSDSSMLEYTITNNPYRSLAGMLCCDDLERELGSEAKAKKMYDASVANGWVPVSMKNDWTTIYGDGVTKR